MNQNINGPEKFQMRTLFAQWYIGPCFVKDRQLFSQSIPLYMFQRIPVFFTIAKVDARVFFCYVLYMYQ